MTQTQFKDYNDMWEFLSARSILERATWILKNRTIIEKLCTPEDRKWLNDWATGVMEFMQYGQGVAGA